MSDLSTRVRAIAFEETPTGHTWAKERLTSEPEEQVTDDREYALRQWGFLYGVAYGIARGEDPYEPNGSVAERAHAAASSIFFDPQRQALETVERFESGAWGGGG